jgi:hypothetical protein
MLEGTATSDSSPRNKVNMTTSLPEVKVLAGIPALL